MNRWLPGGIFQTGNLGLLMRSKEISGLMCAGLLLLLIIANGCKPSYQLNQVVNTSNLQEALASFPDAKTQTNLARLNAAIGSNDFVGSTFILRGFLADPRLSHAQRETVKELMFEIQSTMAEGAEKGDPEAQRAVRQFERPEPGKQVTP